jgi:hypothetical protein
MWTLENYKKIKYRVDTRVRKHLDLLHFDAYCSCSIRTIYHINKGLEKAVATADAFLSPNRNIGFYVWTR